jgi:hypothetical protein
MERDSSIFPSKKFPFVRGRGRNFCNLRDKRTRRFFYCLGNYKRPKLFGHPRNPSQPPFNKGRRIVSPFEKRGMKGDFWGSLFAH